MIVDLRDWSMLRFLNDWLTTGISVIYSLLLFLSLFGFFLFFLLSESFFCLSILQFIIVLVKEVMMMTCWALAILTFLNLHVHEDLNGALDIVDQCEPIGFSHLFLLPLKLPLGIVVDFVIRPDLHREVQFEQGLLKSLMVLHPLPLCLGQLLMRE